MLEGRAKHCREHLGMGKRPNAADSLSRDEEEILWNSGNLGTKDGQTLTNTVWFLISQHLGLRGRKDHHSILVEDFTFKLDDNGNQFITFAEGVTKTRGSGLRKKHRKSIPKMFETGVMDRCPVQIFNLFLMKRPIELRNSGPLYLAIIPKPKSNVWYSKGRLGVNSIDNIMKRMIAASPMITKKKLTNHTVRKTVTKKLRKAGKTRSEIIEITGHSNEQGLDPYDSGDEEHMRQMSHFIDQVQPTSSQVTIFNKNKRFNLLSDEDNNRLNPYNSQSSSIQVNQQKGINPSKYNFFNCNITINEGAGLPIAKKRKRVIIDDDSSQE